METLNKKSFREVFSFNCKITNLFGFFYFSVYRITNERHRKLWEVYFRIKFVFFVIFGVWSFGKAQGIEFGATSNSLIVNIGLEFLVKQFLYTPLAFRIVNFALRSQHEKILSSIDVIDCKLSKLEIEVNHKKEFSYIISATLIQNAFIVGSVAFDYFISRENLRPKPLSSVLMVSFAVIAVFSCQLCYLCLIYAMYWRLHSINKYLEWNEPNQQKVYAIASVQLHVNETLELINRTFFLIMLNYFPKYIIYCTFLIFGVCQLIMEPSPQKMLFVRILLGYVMTIFWFGVFILPAASWVGSEARKMKSLINAKTNIGSAKYLNDFCLQLEHVKPEVNCGLFAVNWNLLFVFVATVFSYLIILVQFESGKMD